MPPDAPSGEPRDGQRDGASGSERGAAPGPERGPEPGELADLRARLSAVEAHEARLAAELRARPRRHRVRSSFAVLLVLPACLRTPLGAVAVWAKSEISDTDRYVATMAPLARDPAVRAAVTDRVTDEIVKRLPVDSLLDGVAPDDRPKLGALLNGIGQALGDGIAGFVHGEVRRVVDSDAFAAVWTDANREAHAAIDRLLTGQGGGAVEIRGDTVVLDLAPLIARVKTALVGHGLSIASRIPEIHTLYTLVRSDSVPTVRTGLRVLDVAGYWVPVLAVACAAGGVLLAVRRRRAAVTAGLGMAGGALLLGVGLSVFRAVYLDALPAGVDQAAAHAVYDALVRFLRSWLGWAAVAGAALALVLWSRPTALVTLCLALGLVGVLAVLELLDEPGRPPASPA